MVSYRYITYNLFITGGGHHFPGKKTGSNPPGDLDDRNPPRGAANLPMGSGEIQRNLQKHLI